MPFVAGLGPAIHETLAETHGLLVDARPKAGHERVRGNADWYYRQPRAPRDAGRSVASDGRARRLSQIRGGGADAAAGREAVVRAGRLLMPATLTLTHRAALSLLSDQRCRSPR